MNSTTIRDIILNHLTEEQLKDVSAYDVVSWSEFLYNIQEDKRDCNVKNVYDFVNMWLNINR